MNVADFEIKVVAAGAVAIGTTIADAVVAPEGSWESIGIKTLLILAIIYLARELAKQRESEAQAGAERERKAEEREKAISAVVAENSQVMVGLREEVAKQTSYFQTVAQTLLNKVRDQTRE